MDMVQFKMETTDENSKQQEGRIHKERLAIPETSSEIPLEESEMDNVKNIFSHFTKFNRNHKTDEEFDIGQE